MQSIDSPDRTCPRVESLLAFHRGGEEPAYTRFLRGKGGSKLPVWSIGEEYHGRGSGSVRIDHLRDMFPSFQHELLADSFFTINSFFRAGTHCERHLRYLNACYSDMDHDQTLPFPEARKLIIDLEVAGVIPPPSIVARSGNGSWAFWLLRDPDEPQFAPWAWPEKIDFYKRINGAIKEAVGAATPKLLPDGKALDASRVTRIDGSMHTGAGRTTRYIYHHNADDKLHYYTLKELGAFFGVEERPHRRIQAVPVEERRKVTSGISGRMALAEYRLTDFWLLHDARGGFWGPPYHRPGCRHYAVLLLGKWMRDLGFSDSAIWEQALAIGRTSHPRLTEGQIRDALNARSVKRVSNPRIQEWLQTTQEELDGIPLDSFRKVYIRPSNKGRATKHRMQVEALVDLKRRIDGTRYMSTRDLKTYLEGYNLGGALDTVKKVAMEAGFRFSRRQATTFQQDLFSEVA